MSWNTTRFTHFKQCKPVFKAVIFFLYNVCFYSACTKKVDFHYTVTNKFSQLCKCKRFNFNSNFLMLTVFAYAFVYRDRMYGFGSDFLTGISLQYHSDTPSKTDYNTVYDTKRDLSPSAQWHNCANLVLPLLWQIGLVDMIRLFSARLIGLYTWDAMWWTQRFTLVAVAFQIAPRDFCGSYT